uniref:Uncharacterized protein n=1 Tax=Glossina austeni TaxID=7395 RepID=A0A1A9UTS6_GLOAU
MQSGKINHENSALRKVRQKVANYMARLATLDEAFKTQSRLDAGQWIRDAADTVNVTITERLLIPRYKYVVQVMMDLQMGAGCHYLVKGYWDVESVSHTSITYTNSTSFCVCTVFGNLY